jgi:meso-butanediol dehydrogenase/(S,S)-butanediol dehydrogenase/diacetyl reductase
MSILQDKVVLVTGAGAGIGRATALAMAEAGADVAAADIDLAAAQRTADQAAGNARRAIAIEADCGDVASIDAMIARTVAELGRLDIIVNNAGVTRYAQIMDLTEADWDRIHRVNAKGVFFCLQRAAREMIRQNQADGSGGRIINIASISGRGYPGASNAAYAASKGAVISLTWMAAQQLGRHNINVNAICPGVTRTELGARNAVERVDGGVVFPPLAFNSVKVHPHFLNCKQVSNTRDKSRKLFRELRISARGINKVQQFLGDEIIKRCPQSIAELNFLSSVALLNPNLVKFP